MNSDTIVEQIQKGFRVTLGATASLVEVIQDPSKREENIAKLNQEWSQLSADWAEKGEVTEQEARSFVDTILTQRQGTTTDPSPSAPSAAAPTATPEVQLEIQELTAQLAAIRAELERLRNQDSPA
jgi:polyhydroxyalkanoate synthesis regulator phasin